MQGFRICWWSLRSILHKLNPNSDFLMEAGLDGIAVSSTASSWQYNILAEFLARQQKKEGNSCDNSLIVLLLLQPAMKHIHMEENPNRTQWPKYPPLLLQQNTVLLHFTTVNLFWVFSFWVFLRNILGTFSVLDTGFRDTWAWKYGIPSLGELHNQLVTLRWSDITLIS